MLLFVFVRLLSFLWTVLLSTRLPPRQPTMNSWIVSRDVLPSDSFSPLAPFPEPSPLISTCESTRFPARRRSWRKPASKSKSSGVNLPACKLAIERNVLNVNEVSSRLCVLKNWDNWWISVKGCPRSRIRYKLVECVYWKSCRDDKKGDRLATRSVDVFSLACGTRRPTVYLSNDYISAHVHVYPHVVRHSKVCDKTSEGAGLAL